MRTSIIVALALVSGCELEEVQHDHDALHEHEHEHAHAHRWVSPEAAARVQIVESESSERETEALGVVDAHERQGHHDEALAELREQPAALGADAVVGGEFHHGEGQGEPTHLSGLAVRYRKLRRDEPFDVVGVLDVALDMEDQDRAIAELRRQAAPYHPDLIIDIHYEHGEGGGKIHVVGKAIRYRGDDSDAAGAEP